ncbi:hypothetical protein HL653_04275 [Sphingomonas sp. AP4-R1]|uniref:hypothetical protein n=1 Tax=Sphingomonas sp. AP4-R1 TaxID=2735134 RepID=UPI0014939A69|nr:hypothetical protein [Sphingomonas sp. AP4-R1]QJU57106.1 hypothetical protein HL653_04275 [Sphingomonas sp. AP4-R1]
MRALIMAGGRTMLPAMPPDLHPLSVRSVHMHAHPLFPEPATAVTSATSHRRKWVMPLALAAALPLLLGAPGRCQPAAAQKEDTAITRPTPLITGVQVHFGGKVKGSGYQLAPTMAAMRALDIVSIRDNIAWPLLANTPPAGIAAKLPDFFSISHRRDLAPPLLTPHGVISTMDGGELPRSPQALRAFASFTGDSAAQWKGGHVLFEIWNEWDKGARRGDHGTPEAYVALVKATAPALRKAAPDGIILAGGAADDKGQTPFEWTKAMIDAGGLDAADALSVHIYDHCAPKWLTHAADEMMTRLDGIHAYAAAHAPGKSDIYVSEFGWPTGRGTCSVPQQEVAENVAQFLLGASTRPWIRGAWYYELKDSGQNPAEIEDNFGLVGFDYRPKPAYCAYQAAARLVRDAKPVRRVRQGSAMRVDFVGKDGPVTAIWLADRTRPAQFQTDAATMQPMCKPTAPAGRGWGALTAMPILLRGKSGGPAPQVSFKAS